MIPGRHYTPADVLLMARRRAVVMLAVFIPAAIAVTGVGLLLPKAYRAEAVILVSAQRLPDDFVPAAAPTRMEEQLREVSQQLLSRTTLSAVIDEFGLYDETRAGQGMDAAIEEMRNDVGLDVGSGNAFLVSYVASDATLAARVADKLSRLILEDHAKARTDFAVDMNRFLGTQLDEIRNQLTQQEQRLDAYRRRHSGALPIQLQANLSALTGAQLQLQSLVQSTNADRDRLDLLRRLPSAASANSPTRSGDTDTLATRLEEARATLATLRSQFTDDHPDIIAQRRHVDDLEREMAARPRPAVTTGASAAAAAAPAADETATLIQRIAEKEVDRRQLLKTLADLQARVDAAPEHEAEFATLSRDYDTLQKLYATLLTKAEEAKIAASLEHGQVDQQFRLLDAARVPDRPYWPNRMRLLALALLGALGCAVLAGCVMEARDAAVYDDKDLRFLSNIHLLGIVNEIVTDDQRRRRRLATAALFLAPLIAGAAGWLWWWRA